MSPLAEQEAELCRHWPSKRRSRVSIGRAQEPGYKSSFRIRAAVKRRCPTSQSRPLTSLTSGFHLYFILCSFSSFSTLAAAELTGCYHVLLLDGKKDTAFSHIDLYLQRDTHIVKVAFSILFNLKDKDNSS